MCHQPVETVAIYRYRNFSTATTVLEIMPGLVLDSLKDTDATHAVFSRIETLIDGRVKPAPFTPEIIADRG